MWREREINYLHFISNIHTLVPLIMFPGIHLPHVPWIFTLPRVPRIFPLPRVPRIFPGQELHEAYRRIAALQATSPHTTQSPTSIQNESPSTKDLRDSLNFFQTTRGSPTPGTQDIPACSPVQDSCSNGGRVTPVSRQSFVRMFTAFSPGELTVPTPPLVPNPDADREKILSSPLL